MSTASTSLALRALLKGAISRSGLDGRVSALAGLSASALELKSDMDSAEKLLEQLDRELG